jgi:hypothetical protein
MALPLRHFGNLRSDQVRQRQVFEERVHEFFAGKAEHEVVFAFAAVARFTAPTAAARLARRPLDAITLQVLLIAGVYVFAVAAWRMPEGRLGHVATRQGDVFTLRKIADVSATDHLAHGLLDLPAITPKEALAIADRLVLSRQTPIDDLLQDGHCFATPCALKSGTLGTLAYP